MLEILGKLMGASNCRVVFVVPNIAFSFIANLGVLKVACSVDEVSQLPHAELISVRTIP